MRNPDMDIMSHMRKPDRLKLRKVRAWHLWLPHPASRAPLLLLSWPQFTIELVLATGVGLRTYACCPLCCCRD